MRLVIVGASGGCGRHLVTQAVGAGHDVVAVGREASDLSAAPKSVTIARGPADDVDFLRRTFVGADVVLVAIGLKLSGLSPFATCEDPTLLQRCGPAIANAAGAAGVSRILAISAGGVGDSRTIMPAFFRAFIALTALRKAYAQLELFERALFAGPVETCCVRPTGLTDEPATGDAVVATSLVGQAAIPRADVAAFMLAHVQGSLPGPGPVITVTGAG